MYFEIWCVVPPAVFFFLKILCSYSGLSWVQMNYRIFFPFLIKTLVPKYFGLLDAIVNATVAVISWSGGPSMV